MWSSICSSSIEVLKMCLSQNELIEKGSRIHHSSEITPWEDGKVKISYSCNIHGNIYPNSKWQSSQNHTKSNLFNNNQNNTWSSSDNFILYSPPFKTRFFKFKLYFKTWWHDAIVNTTQVNGNILAKTKAFCKNMQTQIH